MTSPPQPATKHRTPPAKASCSQCCKQARGKPRLVSYGPSTPHRRRPAQPTQPTCGCQASVVTGPAPGACSQVIHALLSGLRERRQAGRQGSGGCAPRRHGKVLPAAAAINPVQDARVPHMLHASKVSVSSFCSKLHEQGPRTQCLLAWSRCLSAGGRGARGTRPAGTPPPGSARRAAATRRRPGTAGTHAAAPGLAAAPAGGCRRRRGPVRAAARHSQTPARGRSRRQLPAAAAVGATPAARRAQPPPAGPAGAPGAPQRRLAGERPAGAGASAGRRCRHLDGGCPRSHQPGHMRQATARWDTSPRVHSRPAAEHWERHQRLRGQCLGRRALPARGGVLAAAAAVRQARAAARAKRFVMSIKHCFRSDGDGCSSGKDLKCFSCLLTKTRLSSAWTVTADVEQNFELEDTLSGAPTATGSAEPHRDGTAARTASCCPLGAPCAAWRTPRIAGNRTNSLSLREATAWRWLAGRVTSADIG